jgi:hypothetical protein
MNIRILLHTPIRATSASLLPSIGYAFFAYLGCPSSMLITKSEEYFFCFWGYF